MPEQKGVPIQQAKWLHGHKTQHEGRSQAAGAAGLLASLSLICGPGALSGESSLQVLRQRSGYQTGCIFVWQCNAKPLYEVGIEMKDKTGL